MYQLCAWPSVQSSVLKRPHLRVGDNDTVDREIFALKIIRVKIFRVDKFSRFRSIREIFLTVADCNMDERLESLWLLVYYQVSEKPGIARCNHRSGSVDLRASLFTEYRCVIYFSRVQFSRLVSTANLF